MDRSNIESMFELTDADEAGLIDEISRLERVKSAAAAGQARLTAALTERRRAAEAAAGVSPAKQCRGLASEIGLARRDSPARGGRHLGFATALVFEMPHTLAALECGALSEWRATLIVKESACLTVEDRRALDAEMCADVAALDGLGDARITADARAIAYRLDPQAVVDRAAKAESERTVTIRPAPDAMVYVTVLLPVAKGVGVYAALNKTVEVMQPRCRTQCETSRPSAPVATVSFPATRVYGLSRAFIPPSANRRTASAPATTGPPGKTSPPGKTPNPGAPAKWGPPAKTRRRRCRHWQTGRDLLPSRPRRQTVS